MADIPLERRSTGNWWKWLLGIALLAIAIWLIADLFATDEGGFDEGVEDPIEDPIEQPSEQPGEQPPEQSSEQPGDDVEPGADAGQDGLNNGAPALEGDATAALYGTAYARAERIDITTEG